MLRINVFLDVLNVGKIHTYWRILLNRLNVNLVLLNLLFVLAGREFIQEKDFGEAAISVTTLFNVETLKHACKV